MAKDPRQAPQGSKAKALEPVEPTDKRTALEVYRDQQETFYKQRIKTKDFNQAVTGAIDNLKKTNPAEADALLNLQQTGQGTLSGRGKIAIGVQLLDRLGEKRINNLERRSQFSGLLTVASTANAGLNVLSRFSLGAGAYNAQVGGRVIEFEDQQRTWDNLKRSIFLAGSAASLLKVVGAFGAAANPLTIAAVGATTLGQVARIVGDNQALSGERKRQDLDSQYHQEAYGNIVTRGNR
jgi:hypothetical protein